MYGITREEVVKYVEKAGEYIREHADSIVGEFHGLRGVRVEFELSVDELPEVRVEKKYFSGKLSLSEKIDTK